MTDSQYTKHWQSAKRWFSPESGVFLPSTKSTNIEVRRATSLWAQSPWQTKHRLWQEPPPHHSSVMQRYDLPLTFPECSLIIVNDRTFWILCRFFESPDASERKGRSLCLCTTTTSHKCANKWLMKIARSRSASCRKPFKREDWWVRPRTRSQSSKHTSTHLCATCKGLWVVQSFSKTTELKTNKGQLITDLPPKVITQFIVRLSDEEHALLNKELYDTGEETQQSLEISFEVGVVYVGLLGRCTDMCSHIEFFDEILIAAQCSPSRYSWQKGHWS